MLKSKILMFFTVAALAAPGHAELATAAVTRGGGVPEYLAEGVVEAVRDAAVAAQSTGRITELLVQAGDRVAPGQVLLRIDARLAADQLSASRAQLEAARNDYERNQQLFAKQYISQAALDRSAAQYKTLRAQFDTATTQSDYNSVVAPYAGVVASVEVAQGDMALPGRTLLRLYDPAALRVVVSVPESIAPKLRQGATAKVEIPAMANSPLMASVELIAAADAATHAVSVRLALPAGSTAVPGHFARARLPLTAAAGAVLSVPASAVIRRSEFSGVYVLNAEKKFQLRQVRLGREAGDRLEVMAGLAEGERVALDPLAAAKQ